MGNHQTGKNVLVSQSPISNAGRVDLQKNDFDLLLKQKGYDVYVDRSIVCPCINVSGQALSSCKNCGGSGWVFFNRELVRMVIQSMNKDSAYKDWSQQNIGTAKVTMLFEDNISYMDRITLKDSYTIHKQSTHCIIDPSDNKLKAKLIYDPIEIYEVFLFINEDTKLSLLVHETQYTVNDNIIILDDSYLSSHSEDVPVTLSIRYKHNPQYFIIDLGRDNIASDIVKGNNSATTQNLPVHGVARRTHYVLDQLNYGVSWLFDNNYTPKGASYTAANDIVSIIRKTINIDNTNQTLEQLLASGAYLQVVGNDSDNQILVDGYDIDQIDDETSDVVVYVGRLSNSSDKWLIEKITITDDQDTDQIESVYVNGSIIEDYSTNWDNRVNLTYALLDDLINL